MSFYMLVATDKCRTVAIVIANLFLAMSLMGCQVDAANREETKQVTTDVLAAEVRTCPPTQLAGGWSKTALNAYNKSILDQVIAKMDSSVHLLRVNEVRAQVVSGMNYAFEFTLSNGQVWHAIVYQDLQKKLHVSVPATLGPLCQRTPLPPVAAKAAIK